MNARIHPHAKERMVERGATEKEVIATVREGERTPAKFGRVGFRRNFAYNAKWRGRRYANKQVEAIAVRESENPESWVVITVIVRFF